MPTVPPATCGRTGGRPLTARQQRRIRQRAWTAYELALLNEQLAKLEGEVANG